MILHFMVALSKGSQLTQVEEGTYNAQYDKQEYKL